MIFVPGMHVLIFVNHLPAKSIQPTELLQVEARQRQRS
jgi:hypothetical protein